MPAPSGSFRASSFSFSASDGVDGALLLPREVGDDVDDRLQVLVHEGLRLGDGLDASQLAERRPARPWASRPGARGAARGWRGRAAESRTRTGTGSREDGASRRATSRPAPGPASVSTAAAAGMPLRPAFSRSRPTSARSRAASSRVVDVHDPGGRLEEAPHASSPPRAGPAASGRRSRPPACRAPAARAGSRPPSPARRAASRSPRGPGRTRLAMSWLCASRSCFGDEVHLEVGRVRRCGAGSSGAPGR